MKTTPKIYSKGISLAVLLLSFLDFNRIQYTYQISIEKKVYKNLLMLFFFQGLFFRHLY